MAKIELSAIEKEMANFNFDELQTHTEKAKANLMAATSIADVKSEICNVWSKIGKYVKLAEPVPVIGKFIKVLADLLDSICKS